MRVHTILVGISIALIFASTAGAGAVSVSTFGEPLSTNLEATPISSIVAEPDAWVGKRVRIEGEVSGVCTRQGCWMDLVSSDEATLRVKVDDGVIVFPAEATGHSAVAEGEVEIFQMERDQYEAWLRHVADEEGREFDAVEIGDGPYRVVRLRGTGAEIEGL